MALWTFSTGPAVFEHSSSSAPVPYLRGLVDTSVDQSRPNSSKMLADVSSKSADLHGQSSPSALSSHQISPGARVLAHSILSTREEHFTQQVEESRKTHCREKQSSQLVSAARPPVCAVGPRSRHKDTSPRRSKVLSLFADRSQAPLFRVVVRNHSASRRDRCVSLWQLDKARKWTTSAKNLLFQVQ